MVASVKIIRGSSKVNSGSTDDTDSPVVKILKGIFKEIKGLKDVQQKAEKLQRSGIGSALIRGLAAGGGAAGGALSGLLYNTFSSPGGQDVITEGEKMSGVAYEKVLKDGEEQILKINNITGDIIEVLSMREAKERGILDETGNLNKYYTNWTSEFDKITESLPKWRDAVELNSENARLIKAETDAQLNLQRNITIALGDYLNGLQKVKSTVAQAKAFESLGISSEAGLGTNALTMYGASSVGSIFSDFQNKGE